MCDKIRRLTASDSTDRVSEAVSLVVLFFSFMMGNAFSYFSQYLDYPLRVDLGFFRLFIVSGRIALLCWIGVFLIPCMLVLFFSTSTFGCFFLSALFFVFGFIIVIPYRFVSYSTFFDFLRLIKTILPGFFLLPSLFLLGVVSFQKSYQLYCYSSSGIPDPMMKIPRERVIAAFGMVLLAAFVRQYVVPRL